MPHKEKANLWLKLYDQIGAMERDERNIRRTLLYEEEFARESAFRFPPQHSLM